MVVCVELKQLGAGGCMAWGNQSLSKSVALQPTTG